MYIHIKDIVIQGDYWGFTHLHARLHFMYNMYFVLVVSDTASLFIGLILKEG